MKRPLPIFFVGAWCWFAFSSQVRSLVALLFQTFFSEEAARQAMSSFSGLCYILIIWHVVRLINLHAFNRWLTVVLLAAWGVMCGVNTVLLMDRAENKIRFGFIMFTIIALNAASVWYLTRRKLRDFSVQFVLERERAKRFRPS